MTKGQHLDEQTQNFLATMATKKGDEEEILIDNQSDSSKYILRGNVETIMGFAEENDNIINNLDIINNDKEPFKGDLKHKQINDYKPNLSVDDDDNKDGD